MITKESLVSQYKAKYPNLSKYSDDKIYSSLLKKFPEYKSQVTQPRYGEATDMFDSLPNFIKKGYNDSIQGTAQRMMTGKDRFDLSGYEPSVIQDMASSISGIFSSPADLTLTIAGGGVGGIIGKRFITKFIAKKLIKNGVKPNVALRASRIAAKKSSAIGVSKASGQLASYEGFKSAFEQKLETGDIDPGKVAKDTLSGGVLGGVTVGTGAYLTSRGWSTMNKVLGEAGALGTAMPILEGETPTPQDYINAGGMLIGLKAVGGALSVPKKLNEFLQRGRAKTSIKERVESELAEEYGVTKGKLRDVQRRQQEEYIDSNNNKWNIISPPGKKKVKLVDYKKGEEKIVSELDLAMNYKLSDEIDIPITKLLDARRAKIKSLEKAYGTSDSQKQLLRNASLDPKTKSILSNIKDEIKIPTKALNPAELYRYRDALLRRNSVSKAIDSLKVDGWVTQEAKKTILKENFFPEPIAFLMNGLTRAKYRGSQKQPIRKFFSNVGKYQTDKDILTGEYLGRLINTGLFQPTKKQISKFRKQGMTEKQATDEYYKNLSDRVETGELTEINSITSLIAKRFIESGGQLPGFIKNYVPQMMKKDLADIIFDDMLGVLGKKSAIAKNLRQNFNVTDSDFIFSSMTNPNKFIQDNQRLAAYLDDLIKKASPRFKESTKKLINANLESGSNLQYLRAYSRVGNGLQNELFNTFGNLEKSRKFNVPKELLERNLKTLLTRYSTKAANRTSFINNFGNKAEKFKSLVKKADGDDEGIMREIYHHVNGDIQYHSNYNYKKNTKDFWQSVMEWETGLKIGLGYAPVMNITQSTISTALEAGYSPFFRGIFSLRDKKTRELIERSGVTNYSMFSEMIGAQKSGNISSKVAEGLSKWSGFNGINKINQITAAATAKTLVDDLFKISRGKGLGGKSKMRRDWASSKLEQFDINPKQSRLTADDYVKAMSKFARKTQLQKDLLEDPLIFNNPQHRVFTQFKRFGYRQFNYLKDLFHHDIAHGNVMPILRLGMAGVAGGIIANKSKEFARGIISGEKVIDPDAGIPEDLGDIVENLSAVGAFGFSGDLISATVEEGRTVANSLKFLAYPPFLSDVENMLTRFLPRVEEDFKEYRSDALLRMPTRISKVLGSSFIREAGKRFETEGLKLNRIKSTRTRRLDKILLMLEKAQDPRDYDKAYDELSAWNKSFPEFPILSSDISTKKIYKRKLRRYKKRVLG